MPALDYRRLGLVLAGAVQQIAGDLLGDVDEVDEVYGILRRTERDITSHLPRRRLGHRELDPVADFGENRCEYFGQQNCDLWGLNLPLWLIVIIVVGAVCLFFLVVVCIKFKVCECGGGDEPDRSRRGVDKPKLQRLFSRVRQDEGVVRHNPGFISQTSYYGDNSMSIPQP